MKYTYYPGCSLEATSRMYDRSARAVFAHLGAELIELEDWNCCGATAYMSVDEMIGIGISARNLALAEPLGRDLVTPCSGCFVTLNKAHHYFLEYPELRATVEKALAEAGLRYTGGTKVRHLLDPLVNDIGLETIRSAVVKPLKGLKVAPYYGCQIVRPFSEMDDPFKPVLMDRLLEALGATPVPFEYKTRCCGGAQMGTNQDLALRLVEILLRTALEAGAEMICTTCPLCQINLEAYQGAIRKRLGMKFSLPVVYFTQLAAVALGLPEAAVMAGSHIEPFAERVSALSR